MSRKTTKKATTKRPRKPARAKPRFLDELASKIGGSKLNLCIQCGSCVGSCPEASVVPQIFYPRLILQWAQLGLRDKVLSGDAIWICSFCHKCDERCPQGLKLTELWLAMRNLAVEDGHVAKAPATLVKTLCETGRTVAADEFTDEQRSDVGLSRIGLTASKKAMDEIKKIVDKTRLVEKIKRAEGGA